MVIQKIKICGWSWEIEIYENNSCKIPIIFLSCFDQKNRDKKNFNNEMFDRTIYAIYFSSNNKNDNKKLKEPFDFVFLTHLINEIFYQFNFKKSILICSNIDCVIGILLNILNEKKFSKIIFHNPILPWKNEKNMEYQQQFHKFNWKEINLNKKYILKLNNNFYSVGLRNIINWNLGYIDNLYFIIDYKETNNEIEIAKLYQLFAPKVTTHLLKNDMSFQTKIKKIIND